MDCLNYLIFFFVWDALLTYQKQLDNVPCTKLCQQVRPRRLDTRLDLDWAWLVSTGLGRTGPGWTRLALWPPRALGW